MKLKSLRRKDAADVVELVKAGIDTQSEAKIVSPHRAGARRWYLAAPGAMLKAGG